MLRPSLNRMKEKFFKKVSWRVLIIGTLSVLFVAMVSYLAWNVYTFRRSHLLVPRRSASQLLPFLRVHGRSLPFKVPTVAPFVQGWMTFDYLNKTYRLPGTYLRDSFQILDLRYPNISIRRFAQNGYGSVSSTIFLVEDAIRHYYSSSTLP